MRIHQKNLRLVVAVAAFVGLAVPAQGQKTINQSKALAGGVTPGDAPGFPVTITVSGSYKLTGKLTVPNKDTTTGIAVCP